MGAIDIDIEYEGKNIQDAFKKAQTQAEKEYSQDMYSGTINHCTLVKDVTSLRDKYPTDEDLNHYLNNKANKGEVYGYCFKEPTGNTNKIKSAVVTFPQKGKRKWVTKYVAENMEGIEIIIEDSQTQCIVDARKHVEKNPSETLFLYIKKRLESGNSRVAKVTYKKGSDEKDGTYVFIGSAPS